MYTMGDHSEPDMCRLDQDERCVQKRFYYHWIERGILCRLIWRDLHFDSFFCVLNREQTIIRYNIVALPFYGKEEYRRHAFI